MNNELNLYIENATAEFTVKKIVVTANQVLGFDSSLNPIMVTPSGVTTYNYTKTTDYTIIDSLANIFCDCSSNKINITLPVGSSNQLIQIIKTDSTTNTITILPQGSDRINGDTSMIIQYPNSSVDLIFYNGNWRLT